jgi:hypothetical protein
LAIASLGNFGSGNFVDVGGCVAAVATIKTGNCSAIRAAFKIIASKMAFSGRLAL